VDNYVKAVCSVCQQATWFYSLAAELFKQRGSASRTLVLRLLTNGLAIELANLEEVRSATKEPAEKRRSRLFELENRASTQAYRLLAEVLSTTAGVFRRECLLTAFSLAPSTELLRLLQECARKAGIDVERSSDGGGEYQETPLQPLGEFFRLPNDEEFLAVCEGFCLSMERDARWTVAARQKRKQQSGEEAMEVDQVQPEKTYLEGLLSIQGDVLTSREDYDPDRPPLAVFDPDQRELGLTKCQAHDLLTVISSPRWHLLSWALNWTTLYERCLNVLRTPSVRYPKEELRNLVIDYTQFDCSDDEEAEVLGGTESGYEDWVNH